MNEKRMIKLHYKQVRIILEDLQSQYNPYEDEYQQRMNLAYQWVLHDIEDKINELSQ